MSADMKPIHPGEVLLEVYMKPPIPSDGRNVSRDHGNGTHLDHPAAAA